MLDKLGVKPGKCWALWGEFDEAFRSDLNERTGTVEREPPLDAVLVYVEAQHELTKLIEARNIIRPNGMIWAVWSKGQKTLREDDIRGFAVANGLVDVKVVSFSSSLSALKLVVPLSLRQ